MTMHALRLTTRFKENGFQGEACLLVYDELHLNGTMLGDDVRDQFDTRPATARLYILAPFLKEEVAVECLYSGALFKRLSGYFRAIGGQIFLLTLHNEGENYKCVGIPFSIDENDVVTQQPAGPIDAELRSGWLFDLFDRHRGRMDAPTGVHFGKSSGKHSTKFLRTSNVLLSSASCAAVAYFILGNINNRQPRRIFVDTAPLIAVGFAIQRIAHKHSIWEMGVPVSSFSSYGGVNTLPEPSQKDLVLISASTSGSLVDNLITNGFQERGIATLFFLASTKVSETKGNLVCDLTFRPSRLFGYPEIQSYSKETCPFCREGYFLAQLEGDQFQLEKRAIKRLEVKQPTQNKNSRDTLEDLSRNQIFKVVFLKSRHLSNEISLNADELLARVPNSRNKLLRSLRRFTPTPLNYIILSGITRETFHSLIEEANLTDTITCATIAEYGSLKDLPPVEKGNALVLFGFLNEFSIARDINAQLRTIVPKGCVSYLPVFTAAYSFEHLADLKMFLTYGEHGRDTFTYDAVYDFMVPSRDEEISSWELELELLQQLQSESITPNEIGERIRVLQAGGAHCSSLFWKGKDEELNIKNDFVYLTVDERRHLISQADIYVAVSNLLASARNDNRGLNASPLLGKEPIRWHQSVYGHAVLHPNIFKTYNDAVLHAAFLRVASSAELQYATDVDSSGDVLAVIRALVFGWGKGAGDSLPEFLVSIATNRLTLTATHTTELKTLLESVDLPEYLKLITSRI